MNPIATGTEKQIAWATEIRRDYVELLESAIVEADERPTRPNLMTRALARHMADAIMADRGSTVASDWIDAKTTNRLTHPANVTRARAWKSILAGNLDEAVVILGSIRFAGAMCCAYGIPVTGTDRASRLRALAEELEPVFQAAYDAHAAARP